MATYTTGKTCKAYIDDTGEVGDGTWVELAHGIDVNWNESYEEIEIDDRSVTDDGVLTTTKSTEITFELNRRRDAAYWTDLESAFDNKTPIGFAMMDGAIATSGVKGRQLDAVVTEFSETEPLNGVATASVKLRTHANGTLKSTRVTVA